MTIEEIIAHARKAGRKYLTEIEAKELLKAGGISVVETRLATSKEKALALAKELHFPLVLKISSPDILHKSDSGGVKLGIKNSRQLAKAYDDLLASVSQKHPVAKIEGVTVQKMARPGVEVIIGMSQDPQFGPVLMFGLGGILVEILKDVSSRIVPLARRDAREMIREIKGYPLLEGYRGQEPADIPFLEETLLKVSQLVENRPEIKELDINPLFAYKDGAVAVDARVVLAEVGKD